MSNLKERLDAKKLRSLIDGSQYGLQFGDGSLSKGRELRRDEMDLIRKGLELVERPSGNQPEQSGDGGEKLPALTVDGIERQYKDGIHIGSGLPRTTCPCGFCQKHRHVFNQGVPALQNGDAIRLVVSEMISIATSARDESEFDAEWTADNRAQIDRWQARIAQALEAVPQQDDERAQFHTWYASQWPLSADAVKAGDADEDVQGSYDSAEEGWMARAALASVAAPVQQPSDDRLRESVKTAANLLQELGFRTKADELRESFSEATPVATPTLTTGRRETLEWAIATASDKGFTDDADVLRGMLSEMISNAAAPIAVTQPISREFQAPFDMPNNQAEALSVLGAWSNPGTKTFSAVKAKRIYELLTTSLAPIASIEGAQPIYQTRWESPQNIWGDVPQDVFDNFTDHRYFARRIVYPHPAQSRADVLEEAAALCDQAFENVAPGHGGSYEEGCRDAFDVAGTRIRALKDRP